MEVEASMDMTGTCNIVRKRQAVRESLSSAGQQLQKRPCLDYSSCHSDNASNFETENRLFQNMHTSLMMPHSLRTVLFTEQYSCTTLDADTDGNCNVVKQDEEMDVSCCFKSEDRQSQEQPHQSTFVSSAMSSVPYCYRCLTGEPGHISHLLRVESGVPLSSHF
ncbi:uncharacterized protein LOC141886552 [Acropora palmata]|uniref:uncharacterized protein LOC141886552 n=1 Tax=Acropora palmata TaxID=6131 RepID=UPI003DA13F8C